MPDRDRFSGCLVGQCLGDALGFPVEGSTPEICRKYVSQWLSPDGLDQNPGGPPRFGQYTDDSQLARELLRSLVEKKRFEPEDYARRVAELFVSQRIVGRGLATEEAANRLAAGIPWDEAGTPAPSAGNGSAMRAAPIGLFFYDNPSELIRAAHDQGRTTHSDSRCSAGAVAIAGCVSLCLSGETCSPDWIGRIAAWSSELDSGFGSHLCELVDWIRLEPQEAVLKISRCGLDPNYEDSWQGISPFVVGSVLWSLYAFFRTPDDYLDTLRTAIAVGGDVDTTAAMAGALSGAYLGLEGLPEGLARRVTDRGTWEYSELVALGNRCHEIVAS